MTIVEYRQALLHTSRMQAQQCAYARHQFLHTKGLGDVIISARIECGDLFRLASTHGQHDHRHLRPLAQFAQQLDAVAVGQTEIQDDTFTQGQVGLIVGTYETAGVEVFFDNLLIYQP